MRKTVLVRDLMTSLVLSITAQDSIDEAGMEMKFAHVRHLPVIDDAGHVIGMLSMREVQKALATAPGAGAVPIGLIMQRDLIVVTPDTPIQEAIALMLEDMLSCLPVVDSDGSLIGILTETDFLHYVYQDVTGAHYGA